MQSEIRLVTYNEELLIQFFSNFRVFVRNSGAVEDFYTARLEKTKRRDDKRLD